jgi:hypothetical protein
MNENFSNLRRGAITHVQFKFEFTIRLFGFKRTYYMADRYKIGFIGVNQYLQKGKKKKKILN